MGPYLWSSTGNITMAFDSETAYIDHIVAQMNLSLDFLVAQHQISRPDASLIKSKLPRPSTSVPNSGVANLSLQPTGSSNHTAVTANSIPQTPTGHSSLQPNVDRASERAPSPAPTNDRPPLPSRQVSEAPPQQKRARAQWAYVGGAPDDLAFEKGDMIVVESIENADWWRGHIEGRPHSGLFPSNHVVVVEGERSESQPPPPPPPQQHHSSFQGHTPPYPQPQPQWGPPPQQQWPPPQQFQPYDQKQNQPPAPPQDQQQQQQPPQIIVEGKKKNPMKGRMGQAFVGGVGFGAGSAIAGNIVNAIL